MGVIQQETIDELQKQIKRLERLNEENVKRATAAQEQDAREIERLRVELGEMRLVLESQDLRLKKFHDDNERLREAISEFVEAFDRDPIKYADLMDRTREAVEAICRIAREGR